MPIIPVHHFYSIVVECQSEGVRFNPVLHFTGCFDQTSDNDHFLTIIFVQWLWSNLAWYCTKISSAILTRPVRRLSVASVAETANCVFSMAG